ncbi:AraC family transcriptional regulator [Paenibacillus sp. CAA11]|uniref:AraC family transcriptional regulator n=1 Tax=Paenibacillus sp. CAA11 TaxID=1532905 RepID=UPI000D33C57A|nr:AraC family transcriptional regulator [Paenibacillus sp. CAA11]AWB45921.1 AraC family transcriptional regulator [Paenibacillus sp. CAA11]
MENETEALFAIEQAKRQEPFSMDSDHAHDTYEIYYLLSGERNYYIHNWVYELRKGDVIFINKKQLHRTTARGTKLHERVLINFRREFMGSLSGVEEVILPLVSYRCLLLRPEIHEQQQLENILFSMLQEDRRNQPHRIPYLQSLLLQLLIELNRMFSISKKSIAPLNEDRERKVYEVTEYLHAHYAERLSVQELAERFYISSTYLCRLFKRTTGFTLMEYLNAIRIQEAKHLLCDTRLKVTQIAENTGFGSIAHFNRVFKSLTRKSPLQYRKQSGS